MPLTNKEVDRLLDKNIDEWEDGKPLNPVAITSILRNLRDRCVELEKVTAYLPKELK